MRKLIHRDQRSFTRLECMVDLTVISTGHAMPAVQNVEACDLSLSGVGLRFPEGHALFTLGAKVLVTMPGLPPTKAKVCWVGVDRAGLQFTESISTIANSWVGEVFAAQGARMLQLLGAQP
jgi:hypothetical protein